MNDHQRCAAGAYAQLLLVLAVPLSGCGAASSLAAAAVKSQIDSQCGSAGLKACPDIADGAVAYATGNDAEGEAKLRQAAAKNSPEQLRQFTKALAPIVEAADADTARKLRTVIAILEGKGAAPDAEADAAPVAKTAQAKARSKPEGGATPAASGAATVMRSEMDNLRAGMVNPTTEGQLLPCDPTMVDARTCGRSRVLLGPFVVTNLYTSGGCSQELFIASADAKAYWTMLVVAGDRMNVTGRFPVEEGQSLYIGLRGSTAAKNDLRCAVVWSGFRPAEKAVPPSYGDLEQSP